jgi:hypothetical protein
MADLSSIFDWIAGLLFAGAIGMTALTHKEIKYARLVVWVATIMFIVRWGAWALMSKQSWVIKATVGACVGAFVFGAIPPALNWIRSKSIDQPTVPPEAKTLDLYLRVESVVFGGYGETSNEPYAVTVFLTITNPDSVPRLFARWEFSVNKMALCMTRNFISAIFTEMESLLK